MCRCAMSEMRAAISWEAMKRRETMVKHEERGRVNVRLRKSEVRPEGQCGKNGVEWSDRLWFMG